MSSCAQPLSLTDLIDYSLAELDAARESAVEEHFFACESCARTLEWVAQLGPAIVRALADMRVPVPVSAALVGSARSHGATVREYRLAQGETAHCTAEPDDTFIALHLAGPLEGVSSVGLEIAFDDLASGAHAVQRLDDVPVDAATGEVVLLLAGDAVRAYPRSRWVFHATAAGSTSASALGPYFLDHTPWDERTRPG